MGEGELKMSERPVEINKIKPSDYEMAGLSDIVRDYIFDLEQEIEAWEKLDKENPKISGETSDGYHTFNELYDHRCLLWINLCNLMPEKCYLVPEHLLGWFLLGMETKEGQISYHCPNKFYDLINIRISKEHPKYDGHMSKDVIKRLKKLPFIQPKDAVSVPTVEKIEEIISRWDCSNEAGRLRASFEIVDILKNDIQVSREKVMQILLKKGDIVGTEELADFILTIIPNLITSNLKGQDNEAK